MTMDKPHVILTYAKNGVYIHGKLRKWHKKTLCITEDDLIHPAVTGINRLHQQLARMLHGSPVTVEQILTHVANVNLVRIAHLEQLFSIPRYLGIKMFRAFHDAGVAIISGSVMRKTKEYADALTEYQKARGTLQPKKAKYQLPPAVGELGAGLDTMSEEMLFLELAEAEKTGTKQDVTTLLAALKRAKAEARAKQPKRSEVEQFQDAIDEDAKQTSRRRKK